MHMRRFHSFLLVLLLSSSVLAFAQRGRGATQDGFNFRFFGPQVGNRVAAIAGVAGDPNTWYAGAGIR
jgi:hypothetical protein